MMSIREKFGSYHLAETKTAFNPSSLYKYIVKTIPELAGSQWVKSIKACRRKSVTSTARNDAIIVTNNEQPAASTNIDPLDWDFIDKLLHETRKDLANGCSAESAMQQTVNEIEHFSVGVSFRIDFFLSFLSN